MCTYSLTVPPHVAPSFSHGLCFRAFPRVAFPALEVDVVQGGRYPRTRAFAAGVYSGRVTVCGDCLTGDDSIAFDRSFA